MQRRGLGAAIGAELLSKGWGLLKLHYPANPGLEANHLDRPINHGRAWLGQASHQRAGLGPQTHVVGSTPGLEAQIELQPWRLQPQEVARQSRSTVESVVSKHRAHRLQVLHADVERRECQGPAACPGRPTPGHAHLAYGLLRRGHWLPRERTLEAEQPWVPPGEDSDQCLRDRGKDRRREEEGGRR